MKSLPTYEECQNICQKSNGLFYENTFNVDGFDISIFNYRLAQYNDFVTFNALELRGLTFVFNQDGTLYKRFILMEKFFNLGENESTLYETVKNKKIKSIYNKEDGSLISFIELPNGKIVARTKMSFSSEQASLSQNIFESDENVNRFVKDSLSKNIIPIFEYVGPSNRIVVKYDRSRLILLRLRDNESGEYLDISNDFGLEVPNIFGFTLNDLIELKSKIERFEGWVVEFIDGQKIKIKTDWYLSLHRIFTDYSNREDYIINLILEERIDDLLSVLDYGSEQRIFVERIIDKVNNKILNYENEIQMIFSTYDGDKKTLALEYKESPIFSVIMSIASGKDISDSIKEYVSKNTQKLSSARIWLDL